MISANEKLGLPRNKMQKIYFAFDVDGTLRNNVVDQEGLPVANESIRNLLIIMATCFKNVKVIVWSGSGELYARQVCNNLGLHSYVKDYYSKQDYELLTSKAKVIAIDDIQDTSIGNLANLIVRMK